MPERRAPLFPPAALRRGDAATYCAMSPGHFDKLVDKDKMPSARLADGVKIWLRHELDAALEALPTDGREEGENSCDAAFGL